MHSLPKTKLYREIDQLSPSLLAELEQFIQYLKFKQSQAEIVTSDFVLDEVDTLLFKRLPFHQARQAMDSIVLAAEQGYLRIEWITPARFTAARELRLKFQDKPDISFTDLTSMVIMRELAISEILTGDAHFVHIGFGSLLRP